MTLTSTRATGRQAAERESQMALVQVRVGTHEVANMEFDRHDIPALRSILQVAESRGQEVLKVDLDWKQDNQNPKFIGASKYCSCHKAQDGDYIMDGSCICKMPKEHMHCTTCGQYTQIG